MTLPARSDVCLGASAGTGIGGRPGPAQTDAIAGPTAHDSYPLWSIGLADSAGEWSVKSRKQVSDLQHDQRTAGATEPSFRCAANGRAARPQLRA